MHFPYKLLSGFSKLRDTFWPPFSTNSATRQALHTKSLIRPVKRKYRWWRGCFAELSWGVRISVNVCKVKVFVKCIWFAIRAISSLSLFGTHRNRTVFTRCRMTSSAKAENWRNYCLPPFLAWGLFSVLSHTDIINALLATAKNVISIVSLLLGMHVYSWRTFPLQTE